MNEMHFVLLALLAIVIVMIISTIRHLRANRDQRCWKCVCRRSNHIWYFAGCKVHDYCEEFEHGERITNI